MLFSTVFEKPRRATLPLELIWYGTTFCPIPKRFEPATETISGNVAAPFRPVVWSPIVPPHPVGSGWDAVAACHCATWSEWENRFGGRKVDWPRYSARVSGRVRVPTLHRIA